MPRVSVTAGAVRNVLRGVAPFVLGAVAGYAFAVGSVLVAATATALLAVAILTGLLDAGRRGNDLEGWALLTAELERSRRHERPFTLVRLDARDLAPRGPAADAGTRALSVVASQIRSTDRAWPDGDAIFVLLPESEREVADPLLARLTQVVGHGLRSANVASFPTDGVTVSGMLATLASPRRAPGA